MCPECGGWGGGLCPLPCSPLPQRRSPVAHIHVALGQQKCLRKGEPVPSRGLTAFVKDKKTKPDTAHFSGTFSRELHSVNVLRGTTGIRRAARCHISLSSHLPDIPAHSADQGEDWLPRERVTGAGRPASRPLRGHTERNAQLLPPETEAESVPRCHALEEV